uniref:Cyclin T2a n=1 Tax=Haplochromis burtoni TaxID=8153 RepID=A0A3Q2VVN5_HAPBU
MAACRGSSSKWFFTREQLENTPSRRSGVDADRELSYRQQAANLIQDMGQRLNVLARDFSVGVLCFVMFLKNILAYLQQAQELVILESIVLQTLGFEITIDHPHTDVVKCTQLVRASKDLAQTSYFMATNSLHLTTFCLQYKPTVIACVCIHLACKWSNWEIPVSTDGKHWWEYVDNAVTLELLDELTHEFLQILEKTPSRLKRIRNWRATQAAKKPKTENAQMTDNSFPGPSLAQDQADASFPGVPSSNPGFSKAGTTFPIPMLSQSGGAALALDSIATTYNPGSHSEWPQGSQSQQRYSTTCIKQESLSIPIPESLQTSTSSLLQHPMVYKTEKIDFNPVKQEQKGAGASGAAKHQLAPQSAYPPPAQPSPAQKLSLDKYREKHAAELAASGQKRRQEQHASPMKMKVPSSSSGQDRRHHSDKRDKSSLKVRLAVPGASSGSQLDKSSQQMSKDELKMKIKVSSSERHSSSDESMGTNNNKSKHSSPMVSKEKHRGAEHNPHRHHKHSHAPTHSGNGRGATEGSGVGIGLLRGPPGLISMEGTTHGPPGPTSSSRKRAYPEPSHNHHPSASSFTASSKVSKISKGGSSAAGTSSFSSPSFPPCSSPVLQCVSSGLQLYG